MDKANGVTIGTPEDLSLDGTLSSFFARKGIVFDLETGLFRVNNEYTSQIRIVGHGQKYAMVRKALQEMVFWQTETWSRMFILKREI